ncbi:hypothetical protein CAP35_02335 [Chitinophagaceae bacterium IBVUCB1]|nr:hypothetical protein CAP35_02335 [Chitinophagaceae bacterium IBVUCB1]
MKKAFSGIVAAIVLSLVLTACNNNAPEPVAKKFLNSFWQMNYKEAKTVSTEATKQLIELLETTSARVPDSVFKKAKSISIEITKVEENGDKAVVHYKKSDDNDSHVLNLVKQNDKWLANLTKNDDIFQEEPADEAPEAEPAPEGEPTQVAPADTTSAK